MIVTFWGSFAQCEASHCGPSFQPLFRQVLELCENGNEEVAYDMLRSGAAYSPEPARLAQQAKQAFAAH